MVCERGYYKLKEKFQELVEQSLSNTLNGVTNSKELDCAITKAQGLLMLHNHGFLVGKDLIAWGEQVSELVGEEIICEEVDSGGEGGHNGEAGDGQIWLPLDFVCESEELVWEGYDAICEDRNNIL